MQTGKALLIFDLDGTLIDSVPDLAAAVNLTLQDLGRATFTEDMIRHWVGNGAKVLIERALSGAVAIDPNVSLKLSAQALEIFFKHYRAHACELTQAYAGVSEGLAALKAAGYTLAIVTNKPYEFVPTIVTAMHWQGLFDVVLGGDSLPVKKPDPTPLLTVCQTLSITPDQSYMIGDSKNDVLAGHNAGMDTLGLSYGYNYGQDIRDCHPTRAFDTFSELVQFLLP